MTDARQRLLQLVRQRAYREGGEFTLASGKRSTFYIDGKQVTLHPEGLYLLAGILLDMLEEHPGVVAVGGLSVGADPIAAAVCALSFPRGRALRAFLVRKEPKGHGTGSLVEGSLDAGEEVAVVEDTITTGGSARRAVRAVEQLGCRVAVVLALADREDPAAEDLRRSYPVRPVFRLAEIRGTAP